MGDRDKDLGERDIVRGRPATNDTQGHGIKFRTAPDTDQPPSDESEGHGIKFKAEADTDQPPKENEAEGHALRWRPAAPGTDEPPSDDGDTEGHGIRFRPAAPDADKPSTDEATADEAHGHALRGSWKAGDSAEEPPSDRDTEGHLRGRS